MVFLEEARKSGLPDIPSVTYITRIKNESSDKYHKFFRSNKLGISSFFLA